MTRIDAGGVMGPNSISKAMSAASQGMNAQAYRLQVVSENH